MLHSRSLSVSLWVVCCVALIGQSVGAQSGEDLRAYGELYRTFANEHGALIESYGREVQALRAGEATPGELQQAYERFMKQSLELDTRYKQPVTQKLLEVTNERVRTSATTTGSGPERPGVVSPSAPIKQSLGTQPGQKNYRAGFADTDAAAGARTVDQLERVAIEMGLSARERATLLERRPGYTTIDNDLLVTAHKSGRLDRVGSEAWAVQIQVDARQPETYLSVNMQSRRPGTPPPPGVKYVEVLDHQSKAAKGFEVPATALLPDATQGHDLDAAAKLQGMAKGTLKAIDAANLSDAQLATLIAKHGIGNSPKKLRNVMNLLKGGAAITPDMVGLTPVTIGKFQALCRDAVDTSLAVTRTQATAEMDAHRERIAALDASGDPDKSREAQLLREEVLDTQMRIRESERAAAQTAAEKAADEASQRALTAATEEQRRAIQQEADAARRRAAAGTPAEQVRDLDLQVQRRRAVSGTVVLDELKRPPKSRFLPLGPAPHPTDAPTPPPPGERPGFLARPGVQQTVTWLGQGVAIVDVFSEEFRQTKERMIKDGGGAVVPTNRDVLRNMSYTRMTGRGILTLTGIEGAWIAGETAKYEWVKGTQDYIDAETDPYIRIGYDELPLGAAISIMLKATVRQVTLSTYQGLKGIPYLGDLVAAPENLYRVTESSVGVLHDTWTSEQILAENENRQIINERRAAIKARALLGTMRALVAAAEEQRQSLIALQRSLAGLETQAEKVREQFVADRTLFESLLAQLPPGTTTPVPIFSAGEELTATQQDLESDWRDNVALANRCRQLEREHQGGRIDCSVIRAADPQLHQTHTELLEQQSRISQQLLTWRTQLLGATPAADAWRQLLRLQESLAWARDAAQSLDQAAETLPAVARQVSTHRSNLELVRERVLHLHTQFASMATHPRFIRDWEDILDAQRREQIDPALSAEAGTLQREFRRAAAEIGLFGRMELPTMPAPEQPRRIDERLSERLAALETLFNGFGRELERTGELLDGLDQLCPHRPPSFRLRVASVEGLAVALQVDVENVPPETPLTYVWQFGDEQTVATKVPKSPHNYRQAGTYAANVRVFQQTETVSADLGEARATVTVKGPIRPVTPPVATGEERPWLGVSAAWFLEDVPQLPDAFHRDEYLILHFEPLGDGLEVFINTSRKFEIPVSDEEKMTWNFWLEGRGSGRYNPDTAEISVDLVECSVKDEHLVHTWSGNRSSQTFNNINFPSKARRAALIQQTGINPDTRWTAKLTGTLDWKNYKGSGYLDIGPVFRGRWEVGDWDRENKRMIEPEGYGVRIPVDPELRLPNQPLPIAVLYRSVGSAKRGYQQRSSMMHPAQKKPQSGYGDEAVWSPQGGLFVRDGRWCLGWPRLQHRTRSPEEIRPYLERLQSYVRNSRLEELLPEN